MKRYRSTREVLAEVEKMLAGHASAAAPLSLLDHTLDVLYRARHYSWIGIYLSAGEQLSRQAFRGSEPDPGSPHARSTFAAPIRIGGRVLGAMEVESNREHAFGREDRVLLERVAARTALYLASRGKHILRRLRDEAQPATEPALAATVAEPRVPARRPQPVAAKKPLKSVAKPSGRSGLRPASGVTSY